MRCGVPTGKRRATQVGDTLKSRANAPYKDFATPDAAVIDPPRPPDLSLPLGAAPRQPRPLVEVEQEQIREALAFTRGHQGRAATLLGISRKALWEKRRRYGIP